MVLMVTRPASGPAAAASWLPSDRVTGLTDVMLALLFDPGSARRPASAGTRRAGHCAARPWHSWSSSGLQSNGVEVVEPA
jgi:hypothetical protein